MFGLIVEVPSHEGQAKGGVLVSGNYVRWEESNGIN